MGTPCRREHGAGNGPCGPRISSGSIIVEQFSLQDQKGRFQSSRIRTSDVMILAYLIRFGLDPVACTCPFLVCQFDQKEVAAASLARRRIGPMAVKGLRGWNATSKQRNNFFSKDHGCPLPIPATCPYAHDAGIDAFPWHGEVEMGCDLTITRYHQTVSIHICLSS